MSRDRASGEDRRQELVEAAFDVIAERGFEGLRTREVADRVGVNVATLHYHFATKEALIEGVVAHITRLFGAVHASPVPPSGSAALDRLRQEFADTRHYRLERPDITSVVRELSLRATRDAAIGGVLDAMMLEWRGHLRAVLEDGVAEGVLRPDLDIEVGAKVVQAFLWGAGVPGLLEPDALEPACAELERWLRGS